MDIVLHNPHVLWYRPTVWDLATKRKAADKYAYIFDYLYEKGKVKVYIDDCHKSAWLNPYLQFAIWVIANGLSFRKFQITFNIKNIKKTDCLFMFLYHNFTFVDGSLKHDIKKFIRKLKSCQAKKIVHLSHFGYHVEMGSINSQAAGVDLFVAESNLYRNSSFFRDHFSWYKKNVYVLPFVPKKRFKFEGYERLNMVLATGSITHELKDTCFQDYFGHGLLQPMRVQIFENKEFISDVCNSLISNIVDKKRVGSEIVPFNNSMLSIFFRRVGRLVVLLAAFGRKLKGLVALFSIILFKKNEDPAKDRKYYQMDIVRKYNEHTMFVVPEEVIGLPGIGFSEGMLCGAAYIGIEDAMYKDIGMVSGVNYVGYNGSFKDLRDKMYYYQAHPAITNKIAASGLKFAQENFDGKKVMNSFVEYLTRLIQD